MSKREGGAGSDLAFGRARQQTVQSADGLSAVQALTPGQPGQVVHRVAGPHIDRLQVLRKVIPVPGQQAEGGRHSPAGALASDHDLIRSDAQFFRMFLQPEQRRVAVLQGGGIGVVSGQPIVGGDQDRAEFHHQRQRPRAPGAGAAPAASEPADGSYGRPPEGCAFP